MSVSPATDRGMILVVDDDPDVREGLEQVLSTEGYLVQTAENGRVALEVMRAGRLPDLVLLDLTMPVLDGLGFREQQKADPVLAAVPVVVITASGKLLDLSKKLDFSAYLAKPLQRDHLLSIVRLCAPMMEKRQQWLAALPARPPQ